MIAKVSVIIPTYNRAELLGRAIDSVLSQELLPDEVIVVDDCSSDETPAVIAGYGDQIRPIRMPRNSERGACRNTGVRAAKNELVAFLDSDDEWEPTKLSEQLTNYRTNALSVTGIRYVGADGQPTGATVVPSLGREDELFAHNPLLGSGSSMIVPRASVLAVGGFPEDRIVQGSEDWIFLVKLARRGQPIQIVPNLLVRCRLHEGGSTQEADNLARSMWWSCDWMDRHQVASRRLRAERRNRAATSIARAYLSERRVAEGRQWALRALRNGSARVRANAVWRIARTAGRVAAAGRRR